MQQHLTLDELRTAVTELTTAIIDHHPIDDDQWDHAISTLLVAREQHGGRVRQLVHTILGAGRCGTACDLANSLTELHCHLALAEEAGPAPRHDATRKRRPRQPAAQLHLFPDD